MVCFLPKRQRPVHLPNTSTMPTNQTFNECTYENRFRIKASKAAVVVFILTSLSAAAQLARPANTVKVEIHSIEGYGEHGSFARAAGEKLQKVINSAEFQQRVRAGGYGKRNGLTPDEILQRILDAKEVQGPGGMDGVVDLRLRTMNLEVDGERWMANCELDSRARTIGKDGGASGITVTCPQRIEAWAAKNDLATLVGHLMHEYMHQLGFSHKRPGKWRSAVYRIGSIAEEVARSMD